ncbi:MAG: hypothetical protein GY859_36845, partial [Desulfobacterales bacterium]|nr:hypothetical protein [Desulfobacterales bacterium]
FFNLYAGRERWEDRFTEAEDELTRAREEIFDKSIKRLLDLNDEKKATKLKMEISRVDRAIKTAIKKAREPKARMAELVRVKEDAPELVDAAAAAMGEINAIIEPLENEFIPRAKEDYENRAKDIDGRFAPLKKLERDAAKALITARHQLGIHQADQSADYAALGDSAKLIHANLKKLLKSDKAYRSKINELYQSYTKILEDMRIDYFVTVKRESWDEHSDYYHPVIHTYRPSKVKVKAYDYFKGLNPETTAASMGWSSLSVKVNRSMWSKLRIAPRENWPSNHDFAEYWIDDLYPATWHKYTLVKNDSREETDWEEVDLEDFQYYSDSLGMEIVSKPYGFFEEEKINTSSPPGMGFVGNKRYGQWRWNDTSSRSYWHYYGMYSFFGGGSDRYYYRDDWGRWKRDYRYKKPYYGGGSSGPIYGTNGWHVKTSSKYRGSTFSRQGGLKAQSASVRGAGPGRRGGGPGGRGK